MIIKQYGGLNIKRRKKIKIGQKTEKKEGKEMEWKSEKWKKSNEKNEKWLTLKKKALLFVIGLPS